MAPSSPGPLLLLAFLFSLLSTATSQPPLGALRGLTIGFSSYNPTTTFGSAVWHPQTLDEKSFGDQLIPGDRGGGWTPQGQPAHPPNLNAVLLNQAPLGAMPGVGASQVPAVTQFGLRRRR